MPPGLEQPPNVPQQPFEPDQPMDDQMNDPNEDFIPPLLPGPPPPLPPGPPPPGPPGPPAAPAIGQPNDVIFQPPFVPFVTGNPVINPAEDEDVITKTTHTRPPTPEQQPAKRPKTPPRMQEKKSRASGSSQGKGKGKHLIIPSAGSSSEPASSSSSGQPASSSSGQPASSSSSGQQPSGHSQPSTSQQEQSAVQQPVPESDSGTESSDEESFMSHMWGHALMDSAADIVLFTDAEVGRKYGEITKISALTCSFSFPQGVDGP